LQVRHLPIKCVMRPRKKATLAPPKGRKGAELIVKANVGLNVTEGSSGLEVLGGVFILGNRAGYRWLADYCAWRAERIDEEDLFYSGDPDDHDHLASHAPVNEELSDEFDVMFGSFSNRHRRRVLQACGITRQRRCSGRVVALFRTTLEYMRTLSEKDRFRHHEAWPRAIAVLRQLIREGEKTVARLEAAMQNKEPAAGDGGSAAAPSSRASGQARTPVTKDQSSCNSL
jgi:hypothetical protein